MFRSTSILASLLLVACAGAPPAKEPGEAAAAAAPGGDKPADEAAADANKAATAPPAEDAKPTPEAKKADPAKLAKVTKTPEADLKKGLTEKALEDALKSVKVGDPWDKTTKALVAKVGKPSYSMTPGRNSVEEDWIWVVAKGDGCYFNGLSRAGTTVDQKAMGGTYFKMGSSAHVAEEIRSEGAGYLHVCEGVVTATAKE